MLPASRLPGVLVGVVRRHGLPHAGGYADACHLCYVARRALRALCPEMPFLVPGVGAQEGQLERSVHAGLDARGGGMIINASRAVLYSADGPNSPDAARRAAQTLRDAIERHRLAAQTGSRV